MLPATVLIAEDEAAARVALAALLEDAGFRVLSAAEGNDALSQTLHEEPDAVLLDIRMPGLDGLAVLKRALEGGSESAFLIMTAFGDSATAIEAMKLGAFDHLAKPLDFKHVLAQVKRATEQRRAARRMKLSLDGMEGEERGGVPPGGRGSGMAGYSPAMQRVYKLIGQVASSDATVLVRGESGTGKELVVNAIHENSGRAQGPLVKVNCAAIPETLLESELFGHEKGAFTNALFRRTGRFEEANGGTLFLDEIAELAPVLQAKLLRALQERTIERLGSNTPIRVDLRIVTATSRNLEELVARAVFREDLYYRLNVVSIALPPLRERKQDIPALVQHFLSRSNPPASITPAALALLCDHHWPGNVRELENTIARATVLARAHVIDTPEIQLPTGNFAQQTALDWTALIPLQAGWKDNTEALERALIRRALETAHGNKSKAAEILGIHRRLLYEKMRQYSLESVDPGQT